MIIHPNDKREAFSKLRKGQQKRGLSTGFIALDECLRLERKYLTIVTGVPSSGRYQLTSVGPQNGCKCV